MGEDAAGEFDVFGFDGGALGVSPRVHVRGVPVHEPGVARGRGAAAAAAESWRVVICSAAAPSPPPPTSYAATHAAADRRGPQAFDRRCPRVRGGFHGGGDGGGGGEIREKPQAAGARIVGHVGQFAPSRAHFREHNAAAWCVAADRETLVTGDADGNVFARYFGPPEEPRFSGGEQDRVRRLRLGRKNARGKR